MVRPDCARLREEDPLFAVNPERQSGSFVVAPNSRQAGVERALEILRDEIDITLTLLGCPTFAEVDRDALERVG